MATPFSFFEAFPALPTIKIVDIGAMILGADHYATLKKNGAQVIGFEPVEQEYQKLLANASPGQTYLPYAIGDGASRTFYQTQQPMCSSLYEPNTPLLTLFQNIESATTVVRTYPIQTHRLDDIPETLDADFIKIDTQGAELDILRNATARLAQATIVEVEVEFVSLYKNQPLFGDIDVFMRNQGYVLHCLSGAAGRAFKPLQLQRKPNDAIRQLLWSDAVYVKDFTKFELIEDTNLLKFAAILHEVYGSFDLCLLALSKLDARAGSDYSQRYTQRLGLKTHPQATANSK